MIIIFKCQKFTFPSAFLLPHLKFLCPHLIVEKHLTYNSFSIPMQNLEEIANKIEDYLDEKNQIREEALKKARGIIKKSSKAIQKIHSCKESEELIFELKEEATELKNMLQNHLDLFYSGFVENAYTEMCEATILYSIIKDKPLPIIEELNVTNSSYLLGLGDVIGELRRIILNALRIGNLDKATKYLDKMEELFLIIMRFNYPNAIVNIRRKQDIARGLLEKTRGEVAFAIRGKALEEKMERLEKKLSHHSK